MKKKKPILLVSICLNLILIGLIVGGSLRGHNMRPRNGPIDEISAIMFSVPHEVRKDLRDQFKGIASKRDANDEGTLLQDIILRTPFDEEELTEYFEAKRGNNSQIAQTAHSTLVAAIANMTDDERAELAENLNDRPKRRDHQKRNYN